MSRVFVNETRFNRISKTGIRREPGFWDEANNGYRAMFLGDVLNIFSNDVAGAHELFARLYEFEAALCDTKPGSLEYQAILSQFKEYACLEVEKAPVGIYQINDTVSAILYTRKRQIKIHRGGINNAQQRVIWKIALEKLVASIKRRGGKVFGEYDERMRASLKKWSRSC